MYRALLSALVLHLVAATPAHPRRHAPLHFAPPSPSLRASIVVPARDEAAQLPALLGALAAQVDEHGQPFQRGTLEVLVLLNNCTDDSHGAVCRAARRYPHLRVLVASEDFEPHRAHVGTARALLMDAAAERFRRFISSGEDPDIAQAALTALAKRDLDAALRAGLSLYASADEAGKKRILEKIIW